MSKIELPKFKSYEEEATFWDNLDAGDFMQDDGEWFHVDVADERAVRVPILPDLIKSIAQRTRAQGVSVGTLSTPDCSNACTRWLRYNQRLFQEESMNYEKALELIREGDWYEIIGDLSIPENIMELFQYQMMGMSAYDAGHYKEAEAYFGALIAGIEKYKEDDPTMMVVEPIATSLLANNMRMQGKNREALALFARLIALSSDPEGLSSFRESIQLAVEQAGEAAVILGPLAESVSGIAFQSMIADAYTFFGECAQFVDEIEFCEIGQVLEEGIQFVNEIGQSRWASSMRLVRAEVWSACGRVEEALGEAETALGLAQQHQSDTTGYNLGAFQNDIAGFQLILERYDDASKTAQEILSSENAGKNTRGSAYLNLALAYTGQSRFNEARECAQKGMALFGEEETPRISRAYATLSYILTKQGELKDANSSAAHALCAIRRAKIPLSLLVLLRCVQVRLAETRVVMEAPTDGPVSFPIEDHEPTTGRRKALHYIKSAVRFLERGQPLLNTLTSRGGGHPFLEIASGLRAEADSLSSMLRD